MDEVTII